MSAGRASFSGPETTSAQLIEPSQALIETGEVLRDRRMRMT